MNNTHGSSRRQECIACMLLITVERTNKVPRPKLRIQTDIVNFNYDTHHTFKINT